MEITAGQARTRRWQRVMAGVILFGIVVRVAMQVYPPLEPLYQYILSVPYAAFAALVLYDTPMRRERGFQLMLLCLGWAVLTSFFHTYDFNGITKLLPYLLMLLFGFCMCYPLPLLLPEDGAARAYASIAAAFVAGVTALGAIGLYTAVARVMIENPGRGEYEPCGVVFGRLSIFAYPTAAAVFCALALLLGVYLFLQYRRALPRALCLFSGVVNYVALALTGGRIAILFLCACLGGVAYLLFEGGSRIKKRLARVAASLCVAAAVAAVAFLGTRLAVKAVNALGDAVAPKEARVSITMLSTAPAAPLSADNAQETPDADDPFADPEKFATESENRPLFENISTLQGRTYAWKGAIDALLADPLLLFFGASPVYVMDRVDPFVPANTEATGFFHLHSIYFQTLVAFGLPGFLLFAAMIAYILYHAVRVFFLGGSGLSTAERALPLLLAFCLGVDLLEIFLTFSDVTKMSNPLFFLTAGYVVRLSTSRIPRRRAGGAEAR